MKLRGGKEVKTPIQKPLCRLCECPTSDGHVLASQVDRIKLRKWAMKVMNLTEEDENLPEVVGEDALICYFCIWQAEFGDESGDEAVAWWPKNLDLEENAKVLRENYSVGEVEQCWVQLEEVDLTKYTEDIPLKKIYVSGVCLYCGNSYNRLMDHVKLMHREAIKCGIRGCSTFFHTEEEKEQHMQQVSHEKRNKPRESKEIRCEFCQEVKIYSSVKAWKMHMKRKHPEFSVRCSRSGCKKYFKSKSEMILHFNSWHKLGKKHRVLQCKQCEYFTRHDENILRRHVESKHMPKTFKCDSCDAKFGSKRHRNIHYSNVHTSDKCKSCGQDVALGRTIAHRKPSVCSKCKVSFECSGLNQLHRKKCRETLLSCKECGKLFTVSVELHRHIENVHNKTGILRCDLCDHSTFEKSHMRQHMQRTHFFPKMINNK
ncbi:zinc finger protein 54-like [Cloeon dipterum]|uniref:zinc finger protein 54-like n=1 Tax=Cloeon dipterum TaxID=197152 RepID=UPI0032202616